MYTEELRLGKTQSTMQYDTALLPSVSTVALGMFCGAKYIHHTFPPVEQTEQLQLEKAQSKGYISAEGDKSCLRNTKYLFIRINSHLCVVSVHYNFTAKCQYSYRRDTVLKKSLYLSPCTQTFDSSENVSLASCVSIQDSKCAYQRNVIQWALCLRQV